MTERMTRPEDRQGAVIRILPLGRVDAVAAAVAAANLQAVWDVAVDMAEPTAPPDYALMVGRGQYDAGLILKEISRSPGGPPLVLGLTSLDLALPILTFVYGESQLGGRAAVVSTHRLEDGSRDVFYERLAKVCLHEMAHVIGLSHCQVQGCLMKFSQNMDQLDSLTLKFCPQCEHELAKGRVRLIAEAAIDAVLESEDDRAKPPTDD